MREVERRQICERQVEERDPRRFRLGGIEPGQDEKFSGARRGDIPEPNAFAIEFRLFCVAHLVIAHGLHAKDGAVEGVAVAIGHGAFRRHDTRHRIDRHHDRPFKAFGRVHGVECDSFFLGVRTPFDGAGLIGPGCCHRLGKGAKSPNRK